MMCFFDLAVEKHATLPQLAFLLPSQSCTSKLNPPFSIFHLTFGKTNSQNLLPNGKWKMENQK
jgi:hypothetical protein